MRNLVAEYRRQIEVCEENVKMNNRLIRNQSVNADMLVEDNIKMNTKITVLMQVISDLQKGY